MPDRIDLPEPQRTGGLPLMDALARRRTSREFAPRPLPAQTLSDLLWAAAGVSRPDDGRRTAPTAVNWQEIDIYVALPEGLYLYDPRGHALDQVFPDDLRAATGNQDFIGTAPVELIYVSDTDRMFGAADWQKDFYSATDTGFISQNVCLFCASEGLATVVRGDLDKRALHRRMNLRLAQQITLAQSVGYPAD